MKRLCALMIAVLLTVMSAACAEMPEDISDDLFVLAKNTVLHLANGEYREILDEMTLTAGELSEDDFEEFSRQFLTLSPDNVQTEIAVAYWTDAGWKLAVPVTEPAESGDDELPVEAVVFASQDGCSFCGCAYMLWDDVVAEYEESEYVVWNKEYMPDMMFIFEG